MIKSLRIVLCILGSVLGWSKLRRLFLGLRNRDKMLDKKDVVLFGEAMEDGLV